MKRFIFLLTIFIFITCLNAINVYFLTGSSTLTQESIENLRNFKAQFEEFYRENPTATIIITGYTDNVGSAKKNRELSKNRAESVKDFLVREFGMNPKYMEFFGMGSENPIASNETAEGRSKNRRVEIEFQNPEARIKWLQNLVEHIPYRSEDAVRAKPNEKLFRYDKVNTEKEARSGIEFYDENMVILEENSLMIIFGDITAEKADLLDDKFHVELKYGKLFNKLQNLQDKSINIKTPAADLELYSAKNDVEFNDNQTIAAIYEGYGLVFAQGETVKVNEGFGVKVETGKAPETPVQLPAVPADLEVTDRSIIWNGDRLTFSWNGVSENYLIQISSKPEFEDLVKKEKVSDTSYQTDLAYGDYFLRVRAIDKTGLSSEYSEALPISVQTKKYIQITSHDLDKINKSNQKEIVINGTTMDDIRLKINGEMISRTRGNDFTKTLLLQEGMNNIDIIAVLPDNSEQVYSLQINYEPAIEKEITFEELKENEPFTTTEQYFQFRTYLPLTTSKLYINGEEIEDDDGKLNYSLRLEPGINEVNILAIFMDGTEKEYNYQIIYEKPSGSGYTLEIIFALFALGLLVVPLAVN